MNASTNGKAPSSLSELKKLVDSVDDGDEGNLTFQWLQYIHDSLTARKLYHKKQQIKRKLLFQTATEMLQQDELDAIDKQAEDLSSKQLQVEEETT
jgi:hypothetical protein